MKEKSVLEILELYGQFIARLFVPILLVGFLGGVIFRYFVASNSAPYLGVLVWPLQVGAYHVADVLLTRRDAARRMIVTIHSQKRDDDLLEIQIWAGIAIISFVLMIVCFYFPAPFLWPFAVVVVPHVVLLAVLSTDRQSFTVFASEVFPPIVTKRAERRTRLNAERQQREQERERGRRERKAEKPKPPKSLDKRIDERNTSVDAVIKQIRSLNIEESLKEQLVESVENQFRDWLVKTTNEDSFGA